MVQIQVDIPGEISLSRKEISETLGNAIKAELVRKLMLKRLNDLLKDSELTEKDAIELGRKIKKGRHEEIKEKG